MGDDLVPNQIGAVLVIPSRTRWLDQDTGRVYYVRTPAAAVPVRRSGKHHRLGYVRTTITTAEAWAVRWQDLTT